MKLGVLKIDMMRLTYRSTVFARDGYACSYCGALLAKEDATVDHVEPTSRGGRNHPDNMVVACFPCNNTKGSLTLIEFLRGDPWPESLWAADVSGLIKLDEEARQAKTENAVRGAVRGLVAGRLPKVRPFVEPRVMKGPTLRVALAEHPAFAILRERLSEPSRLAA